MGKKRAVKKKKRKLKPVTPIPPAPYTEEQYREAAWFYLERDDLQINGHMSTITDIIFDEGARRVHHELGDGLGASVCIHGDCFITDEEVAWYFKNFYPEDE